MHRRRAVRPPTSSCGRSPPRGSCSAGDDAPAGAAEPRATTSAPLVAAGHRRLGRRLAGHARPREPRAAVARARRAARRDRGRRARCSRRASPIYPEYVARRRRRWLAPRRALRRCSCASDCEGLGARRRVGRRRRRVAPPPLLPVARRRRAPAAPVGEVLDGVLAGEEVGVDEIVTLLGARGPEVARVAEVADELRREIVGDDGHLRPQPQHQLHERLHVQVPVLRVLEGPAVAEPARRPVPPRARGDPAARRRGRRVRRDRGVPAGRHPSRLRRRLLRRRRARGEGGRARASTSTGSPRSRSPKARAGSACRSRDYLARLKDAGPGDAARHRGRDPRRRGARGHLPRQGQHRGVARGAPHRAPRRPALERHDHVRHTSSARSTSPATSCARVTCRRRPAASPSSCRCRSCTWRHRSSCRARRGAGPTFREVLLDARGRPHRVPRLDRQHPGVVGEDAASTAPARSLQAGCQRPRRHADGREHLAGRGREPRPGARRGRASARSSSRSAARSSSAPRSTAARTTVGPPARGRRRAHESRRTVTRGTRSSTAVHAAAPVERGRRRSTSSASATRSSTC